jgi:hypothetical protein
VGGTGKGKSCMLEHMILDDIARAGVAVIDPHGDLIERLLHLLPPEAVGRTIYFDPGDPLWVPIWNPLKMIPGQDVARTAGDFVSAIKSVVTGWGDRLEHLLRNIVFATLHLQGGTVLDVSNLLRNKDPKIAGMRNEILQVIDNETAWRFWDYDHEKYGKDDLGPPKNKLSKLLISGTVSLMLSQPDSAFNFRQMLDEGMIFLSNLSGLSSDLRDTLGCLQLSLLHLAALSRAPQPPGERRLFHVYLDEAHRFITGAMEDTLVDARKYGVGLTLAHQYLKQFSQPKIDALGGVGTTIIVQVNRPDAEHLVKGLHDIVDVDTFTKLGVGEAIVRADTDITRVHTPPPRTIPASNYRDQIIAESRRRYCKPVHEVRQAIRLRRENDVRGTGTAVVPSLPNGPVVEFTYEEL